MKQYTGWLVPCAVLLALSTAPAQNTIPSNAVALAQDALPFIGQVLETLSAGRYEEVVDLTDFDGAVDYLVRWKVDEARKQKPDMNAKEEADLVRVLRDQEVSREQVRDVLLQTLEEQDPQGMKWELRQVIQSERVTNGLVVTYMMIRPDRNPAQAKMGLQRKDGRWMLAPQLPEEMALLLQPKAVTPPESAVRFMDAFWTKWNQGALEDAYDSMDPELKKKLPLVRFLESIQTLFQEKGALVSWELGRAYSRGNNGLNLFYRLEFSQGSVDSRVGLIPDGETWKISLLTLPYPPEPDAKTTPAPAE